MNKYMNYTNYNQNSDRTKKNMNHTNYNQNSDRTKKI